MTVTPRQRKTRGRRRRFADRLAAVPLKPGVYLHRDRDGDRQLSLWLAQDGVNTGIQVDPSSHVVEHIQDRVPEVLPLQLGHGKIGMQLNQCLVDDIRHNVLLFHKTLLDLL